MNHKQKLGYTLLGAGIMAIGIIIGQVITPDIEPQSNGVFDKITCREIEVIDNLGEISILLGSGEKDNFLALFDKVGEPAILLASGQVERHGIVIDDTNSIMILGRAGREGIALFAPKENEPTIGIIDGAGNAVWRAP